MKNIGQAHAFFVFFAYFLKIMVFFIFIFCVIENCLKMTNKSRKQKDNNLSLQIRYQSIILIYSFSILTTFEKVESVQRLFDQKWFIAHPVFRSKV